MSYREDVMRTVPKFGEDDLKHKLGLGGMGLSGEAGEVTDLIKKVLFHGKPLPKEKLVEELGDVRWYLEYLAAALEVTMEEVEAANIAKLRKRYPQGFSYEAANAPRYSVEGVVSERT